MNLHEEWAPYVQTIAYRIPSYFCPIHYSWLWQHLHKQYVSNTERYVYFPKNAFLADWKTNYLLQVGRRRKRAQDICSVLLQGLDSVNQALTCWSKDEATGRQSTHLSYTCSVSLHQVVYSVCRSIWEENVFVKLLKESEGEAQRRQHDLQLFLLHQCFVDGSCK